jgi:hypothetical protein
VGPRKRAPGGGRKPLNPDKVRSAVIKVRLTPDHQLALDELARRNDRTLSQEIRDALLYWLLRSGRPELHIASLTSLIEVLITEIERRRERRRFTDDPAMAVAVREEIDFLIRHYAPESNKSVTVPRDLKIGGDLIALAELAKTLSQQIPQKEWLHMPELLVRGPPPARERIAGAQGSVLARIMEGLGGLERNQPRRRHK